MLKPNEICLRSKQITTLSEKMSQHKKYILCKKSLKFQNSKSNISCKIAFYIYFCYELEFFGVRSMKRKHKWLNKTVCFNFLKNWNCTQSCLRKQDNKQIYLISLWLVVYHHHLYKIFFYKGTSHWWFIAKSITLSENTPVRLIAFFFSVIVIVDAVFCILWWLQ